MAYASIMRLLKPLEIRFNDAILVAVIGLVVNLASSLLLKERHDHHHGDCGDHTHDHDNARGRHPDHDHNLRAAYLHVLADALTSILQAMESGGDATVEDVHLWRVGPGRYSAIFALTSSEGRSPLELKKQLCHLQNLVHVTIEVNRPPEGRRVQKQC